MKNFLLLSVALLVTFTAFTQEWEQAEQRNFFAQGMLDIPKAEMIALQDEMRLHPNLEVVRLDHNSNRFFLLIRNLSELTEDDLLSWFGHYSTYVKCVQIGVHGVDVVHAFPFVNCPN